MKSVLSFALAGVLLAPLTGCMVGPKYVKPPALAPDAYKEDPPASYSASSGWKPSQPADDKLKGKWWEIFNDPRLNDLEDQLTVSNQSLKVSEARLRESRSMIRYNKASQYPTIGASPSIANERESVNQPYFPTSAANNGTGNFILPADFSYEVDLWGRVRRTVSASREEAQATAADLQTASLSLHAELAADYIELRCADQQEKLLKDTVADYEKTLQLTEARFSQGASPRSDVTQAKTQLDAARVQQTDVTVMRAQYEHAIATLIGQPPAQFSIAPSADWQARMPVVPVGVPSELLERRSDIAANERRVAEANDQVGIARAAFFPSLVLGATAGLQGSAITNWLTWPARFWSVGPQMSETLFDAGRRSATSEAAMANYDASVASYRQATLTAFQEVEDGLAALRILEKEQSQQQEATASAEDSLQLFTQRYRGGVDSYLQVVTAQTVALANERNEIDIDRRRMDATVLLVKAVGGGWDITGLPKY